MREFLGKILLVIFGLLIILVVAVAIPVLWLMLASALKFSFATTMSGIALIMAGYALVIVLAILAEHYSFYSNVSDAARAIAQEARQKAKVKH